jgi:ribonucleotide monophosphatase NagD (HAD superfamily)
MIGDRLDTDIDFGLKGGLETLCVLTGTLPRNRPIYLSMIDESLLIHTYSLFIWHFAGVASEQDLLDPGNPIKPTYYVDSFAEFGQDN